MIYLEHYLLCVKQQPLTHMTILYLRWS